MASSVQKGDQVTIASGAVWTTGASVPAWVRAKTWIVSDVSGSIALLNKPADGSNYAIQSRINISYLTVVSSSSSGSGSGSGSGSSSSTTTYSNMATNVQLIRAGNTFTATWDWRSDRLATTDHYLVRWYCHRVKSGDKREVDDAQVSASSQRRSDWTLQDNEYPDYVTKVWFHVKPVSKTKDNSTSTYWTADWSTGVGIDLDGAAIGQPSTPSAPTLEMNGYNLTATVSGLEQNYDEYRHWVEFELVTNESTQDVTDPVQVGYLAATYTWNNLTAGNKYKVRCRLLRTALSVTTITSSTEVLYSNWSSYSEIVSTVPVAIPSFTSCRATNSTSVLLGWAAISTATSYEIQYATKEELGITSTTPGDISGYFNASSNVHNITGIQSTTFYTVTGLTSGYVYYFRIRAVNTSGNSEWSTVSEVILGSKPQVPTTWSSTTTAIEDEDVILYWVHNSKDGSKESSAQISYTISRFGQSDVTDTVTIANTLTDEEYEENRIRSYMISNAGTITLSNNTTISMSSGATIKWKVKTAGVTNEYSDWSVERQIDIYARPTVTLQVRTSPSASDVSNITGFPFYISATTTPSSQTPVGYHLSIIADDSYETTDAIGNTVIIDEDTEIYSKYFDVSTELLVKFTPGNINLVNNIGYTVKCIASMNSGLTATDEHGFTVSWAAGTLPTPNASIGVNYNDVSVFINPYCESEYGVPVKNVDLAVYRKDFDGSFVEIGSGISNTVDVDGLAATNNTYVIDPHPPLNYARYRIVATSTTTGVISYTDIPAYPINEKAIIIQWDEQWSDFIADDVDIDKKSHSGSLLRLPYNISVSDSYDMDVSLVKYIGRKRPVSYYGTQLGEASTWTVDIPKNDEETLYALRRLAIWTGDVYIREPSGSGYWAKISLSSGYKYLDVVIPVSIQITRVEASKETVYELNNLSGVNITKKSSYSGYYDIISINNGDGTQNLQIFGGV